jgi:hypothetical protein
MLPRRPPPPWTVRTACFLMAAGAALRITEMMISVHQEDARRRFVPGASSLTLHTGGGVSDGVLVTLGLVETALWIWMACANGGGRNWARITASVLFGMWSVRTSVGVFFYWVSSAAGGTVAGLNTVMDVLIWLAGLIAIVMLWHRRSKPHFTELPQGGPAG